MSMDGKSNGRQVMGRGGGRLIRGSGIECPPVKGKGKGVNVTAGKGIW